MSARLVAASAQTLVRVGKRPRAGHFPDPRYLLEPENQEFVSRFDDPKRRFSVLYAAEQAHTAYLETLAKFRRAPGVMARYQALGLTPPPAELGRDWVEERDLAHLEVTSTLPFLDLRAPESYQEAREALASVLQTHHLTDFDAGVALHADRALTRQIAGWAFEQGWAGVLYPSRHDVGRINWAIFHLPAHTQVRVVREEPLLGSEPEFVRVLGTYGLTLLPAAAAHH